jgi:hypothetical protein
MIRVLLVFVTCLGVQAAGAVVLSPVGEPHDPRLAIDPNAPDIPCGQIVQSLSNYNVMARQHDAAVSSFLAQVSAKLGEWHDLLRPLEGDAQPVAPGTFAVLQDGADKVGQINATSDDNSQLLAAELARIQYSLEQCKLESAARPR